MLFAPTAQISEEEVCTERSVSRVPLQTGWSPAFVQMPPKSPTAMASQREKSDTSRTRAPTAFAFQAPP